MPSASDTAYPRLKANPSDKELTEIYTPTENELTFVRKRTNQPIQRVGLLLLLKTFQRLGYFVSFADIPDAIVRYIASCAGFPEVSQPVKGRVKFPISANEFSPLRRADSLACVTSFPDRVAHAYRHFRA